MPREVSDEMVVITQDGYTPVTCLDVLPCPFCGTEPELRQVAHEYKLDKRGKRTSIAIIASTRTLTSDRLWFGCPGCGCTSGGHHSSGIAASAAWNTRKDSSKCQEKS